MPTFKIDLPNGASYQIDAADERQLSEVVSKLTGKSAPQQDKSEVDPSSPEWQAKYGPTSGSSFLQNAWEGLGSTLPSVYRGIRQANEVARNVMEPIVDPIGSRFRESAPRTLGSLVTGPSQTELDRLHAEEARVRELEAPLMRTGGGLAGRLIGTAAVAAPTAAIPGAGTYAGTAAIGTVLGALQPTVSEKERALNAGIGGVAAVGTKFGLDRLGKWAANRGQSASANADASASSNASASAQGGNAAAENTATGSANVGVRQSQPNYGAVQDAGAGLTETQQEILDKARKLGFRATPGQATGSRSLQQVEAKLESQPMTSGAFNKLKSDNQRTLARIAARSIGEDSSVVDSATLDRAFTRTGAIFDSVKDDVPRAIDPKTFVQKYSDIQNSLEGLYEGFDKQPLVQRLVSLAENGSATGEQLQQLNSKLGRAAYKQMTSASGDRDLGAALYSLKDYVDDLLQSGLSGAKAAAFGKAREQYRMLMILTGRVGIVNPSTGNVSGANLANALQRADKSGFLRGKNASDLYTAARFAQAFKPLVNDSGTATRSAENILDLAVSVPFNIASRAYVSGPSVNAAVGAGAASRATGSAVRGAVGAVAPAAEQYAPLIASPLAVNALMDRPKKNRLSR